MSSRLLLPVCLAACSLCLAACADPVLHGLDAGLDAGAGEDAADAADGTADADEAADGGDGGARCEAIAVLERGELTVDGELREVVLGACERHRYTFVAAYPARLELELEVDEPLGAARALLLYPDAEAGEPPIAALSALEPGEPAVGPLAVPRSGELVIELAAFEPERTGRYRLCLRCAEGCELECTRFPIVLVHGWTGWDEIGSYTYFYGVPDHLERRGYAIYVASLDPYNSVELRSGQLAAQVEATLADARARKVDLIAHSQGGLDSRRLISTLGFGDRISALVTVSTPHRGTPLTDVALGVLPGPGEEALAFLLEWLGATAVGSQSDAIASFESMTVQFVVEDFNPANPDDDRVAYVSYAGRTCPLGISCGDVCDVEIRWSYDLLWLLAGANDGVVPVDSAVWGDYRGEIPADHFDEIGQLLGVTGPNFDHQVFYLQLARDLAAEGH
ncbi:MAG: triacylglycerol lipase [Deltaproteobacteria bacterium]|nr:triacylglycerol lipase [Deltaproteobacteria bacterium]